MRPTENIRKYSIFIDVRPTTGFTQGFGIIQPSDRSLGIIPETDFYVPVFLTKGGSIYEYVNIQQDKTIQPIQRQNINPFFIEFDFFDTIIRNKINVGIDLTSGMFDFIRTTRPEVTSAFTDTQIIDWFDSEGKNELPWFKGTPQQVTIDDIDKSKITFNDIISKASFFPIKINS
jgi:hypothetical protein